MKDRKWQRVIKKKTNTNTATMMATHYLGMLVGNIRNKVFWKGLWKLIAIAHYVGLHAYTREAK